MRAVRAGFCTMNVRLPPTTQRPLDNGSPNQLRPEPPGMWADGPEERYGPMAAHDLRVLCKLKHRLTGLRWRQKESRRSSQQIVSRQAVVHHIPEETRNCIWNSSMRGLRRPGLPRANEWRALPDWVAISIFWTSADSKPLDSAYRAECRGRFCN